MTRRKSMTDIESFLSDARIVSKALGDFIDQSREKAAPVLIQRPIEDLIRQLDLENLTRDGGLTGARLEQFLGDYLANCTRLHHPGYMAHQVATTHPSGALGSFIDGVTNNPMTVYEMGPAASTIEYFLINWMLEKIGWRTAPSPRQLDPSSPHGGGVLTHGGSLANLTALIAARGAMVPDFWTEGNPGNLVILVPEQSHYSMKRAAAILGFGEKNCLTLPADHDGRVRTDRIPAMIDALEQDGKRVVILVANACGTAAGLYDPLAAIGEICRARKIWLHVDAAHGGGALLSKKYRLLLDGIDQADSIIWDAHKMLRTPAVCAAVLVKQHRHLDHAFAQEASYLIHEKDQPGFDFLSRSLECTKAALGLRLFMTLAAIGEQGMKNHVDNLIDLARQSADYIDAQDDFEVAVRPQTNILCFRSGADDRTQLDIRRRLLKNGNFLISTTQYRGHRWLRLVFMNPLITLDDVEALIAEIRQIRTVL